MRTFEFALNKNKKKMYENAQLPEYQTAQAAGADFFCAEEIVVPTIWRTVLRIFYEKSLGCNLKDFTDEEKIGYLLKPTLIHTGIKSAMEADEVLELYNRSSNPKKLGLILANGVGVVDADYYENPDNDGEIMFAFYNILPFDVTVKKGERIGQGVFKKYLRPTKGFRIKETIRSGGFGSTGK